MLKKIITMCVLSQNLTFQKTVVNTSFEKEEILAIHKSFMSSMISSIYEEYDDLSTLYIGYQNFRRIQIEKDLLPVHLLVQQKICL